MGFYQGAQWQETRRLAILSNIEKYGSLTCEYCHMPIAKSHDCIVHHKVELTESNVFDFDIAYSLDNLQCVHMRCHNAIHQKGFYGRGRFARKVYLVYGEPDALDDWLATNRDVGDLIVYVPELWLALSGGLGREGNDCLLDDVLRTRDFLLDRIYTRSGQWRRGLILGGYGNRAERERMVTRYDLETIAVSEPND